jgi:putative hydrolase of HD superfamily
MKKIPEKKLIDLALQFGILKRTVRTGWKRKGIKDPESVAEHSFRVSVLAMLLAPYLNVDRSRLVKMSLIHDLGESSIGDLIWERGARIIGSQIEKHKDEGHAVRRIFESDGEFDDYFEIWKEFEEQKTKEALIVKQLDKLEMTLQALEYEKEGYSSILLEEFWENSEKYLKGRELEPVFRALQKLRNN